MGKSAKSFYMLNIGFWIVVTAISFFVLNVLGMTAKQSVAFLIVSIFAIVLHINNAKNNPNYIKSILCLQKQSNRTYELDHLRFIAVSFVIITHTVQINNANGLFEGENKVYIFTCIYILTLACNLIYVMLSGALLLPWKEEKITDFYLKRLPKVIIPMLIYYVWYLWQSHLFHEITFSEIWHQFSIGMINASPHFWLILIIISLYIVYPFIRYMLKDLPYSWLTALVVISLIFMGTVVFTSLAEPFYIKCVFADWIGVAIIGYWLTRKETKHMYPVIFILGLICAVVICFIIKNVDDYIRLVTNCSPFMVIFSAGIFSFVLWCKPIFAKGNYLLRLFSKYSYSIILIHWWSLNWVTFAHFNIRSDWYGFLGIFVALFVTLIVSLGGAFIVDNLIVYICTFIWDKIVYYIKKIVSK